MPIDKSGQQVEHLCSGGWAKFPNLICQAETYSLFSGEVNVVMR